MEEATTQLADTRPLLDTPLRMSIPVNVPDRILRPSRDTILYSSAFSSMAIAQSIRRKEKFTNFTHENMSNLLLQPQGGAGNQQDFAPEDHSSSLSPANSPKKKSSSSSSSSSHHQTGKLINMDHDALNKNALKDFQVLAFSSKRAGKKDVEATAYASLGVIHDNQEDYMTSIEQYKLYLQLCEELGDMMGISAACNCIGVNYMLMALQADQQSGSVPITASAAYTSSLNSSLKNTMNSSLHQSLMPKMSDQKREYLQQAIIAHSRHNEVSPDGGGKFVAFVNLGICLTWLGDINQAARHHQDALRIAIKMQTLYGQSIAVGNLGLLALNKHDFITARTCFDQVSEH